MNTTTQHTALPNHTCFTVVDSFGVELPYEVIIVDVVRFELPDTDRYNHYGVMVNGEYNANLRALADISGNWKEVAMSNGDARRIAALINSNAERGDALRADLRSCKSNDRLFRLVREYNNLIDFFASYGVDYGRKLRLRAGKIELA